jgi:hypothetical protein
MMSNKKHIYSTSRLSTVLQVRDDDTDTKIAVAVASALASAKADNQKAIDEAIAAATTGLKTKNDELLGKLKAGQDKLKEFDGVDPATFKAIQARLDNDEDIKLFSEGKKNEVIFKYTERMRQEHVAQLQEVENRVKAEAARADTYKGSVLDNQIRSAAGGLHKGAIEDALLHARNIFSLDAKGVAVKLDSQGTPELGKDGKTPYSPAEWMEQQKELRPHWFPMGSTGSGSGSVKDSAGNGKTIKRSDFDQLSPADKSASVRNNIQIVD